MLLSLDKSFYSLFTFVIILFTYQRVAGRNMLPWYPRGPLIDLHDNYPHASMSTCYCLYLSTYVVHIQLQIAILSADKIIPYCVSFQ